MVGVHEGLLSTEGGYAWRVSVHEGWAFMDGRSPRRVSANGGWASMERVLLTGAVHAGS